MTTERKTEDLKAQLDATTTKASEAMAGVADRGLTPEGVADINRIFDEMDAIVASAGTVESATERVRKNTLWAVTELRVSHALLDAIAGVLGKHPAVRAEVAAAIFARHLQGLGDSLYRTEDRRRALAPFGGLLS